MPATGGTTGVGASISSPTGLPRRQATALANGAHPTACAMPSPSAPAASWKELEQEQVGTKAGGNRPRTPGARRGAEPDRPPPEPPPIVTRAGSPPKAAMFCCTQRSAACWSISP